MNICDQARNRSERIHVLFCESSDVYWHFKLCCKWLLSVILFLKHRAVVPQSLSSGLK